MWPQLLEPREGLWCGIEPRSAKAASTDDRYPDARGRGPCLHWSETFTGEKGRTVIASGSHAFRKGGRLEDLNAL